MGSTPTTGTKKKSVGTHSSNALFRKVHTLVHKSPARRFPAGRAVYLGDLPGWRVLPACYWAAVVLPRVTSKLIKEPSRST